MRNYHCPRLLSRLKLDEFEKLHWPGHHLFRKCYSTHSTVTAGTSDPKLFKHIPGPKSLPLIGTLLNYVPLLGDYKFDRLHRNGMKKLKKYGKLVKEEIVPGVNVVWVFDPSDIETVFKSEGRYPERRSHLAVEKYRRERPEIYSNGGLLPTNGADWWHLRSKFQQALSRPQNVKLYIEQTDAVIQEFIELVRRHSKSQKPHDYLHDLSHLFMELVGLVAFDVNLGSLTEDGLKNESRSSKLIKAAETTNSCVVELDNGLQLWKFMETPLYKKFKIAYHFMESVALELVSQKATAMEKGWKRNDGHQASLLEQYLLSPDLSHKDIVGMAVDMILAGMDTTSYTSSFALYHLAMNPESQKLMHQEALKLLPEKSTPVTSQVLNQASYTKAALKETFRLNPISVGIGRILAHDAVLSGFHVPAGTVVVTQNQVSCRLPEYFPDPDRFVPERWLKGHALYHGSVSPYLVLPFGHGPRSCIARRLAEQNMQILLLKVCRNFRIGWSGGLLDVRTQPVNKPDEPVLLTFDEY
ncbi:cytochrome P450 302a1, mitochondrial [Schistocerca cancellata]|uniref:cytochrome P450 302a1, mitochondrial n=1 Tax=Schistocerca cancellata TaxID=274614 RepID=UPI0021177FCF|nr:cytochrome P450 302a1, mitochondrial [Schistocerca cancellata]XP_049767022.1 cytochrome P450 302a1, mitochondrial [Schistocerca cancellata]